VEVGSDEKKHPVKLNIKRGQLFRAFEIDSRGQRNIFGLI
jgi:hypothetical protein